MFDACVSDNPDSKVGQRLRNANAVPQCLLAFRLRKAHSRLIRNGVCVWRKWAFVALVMVSYVRSVRFVYVMRLRRLCDAPLPLYI